ncbi:MAG TPA: DUF2127 domain-containing protein [Tepidisphaeraceae bacterium]|jgi:uncharacterized membrane protein (DUF2068 family)
MAEPKSESRGMLMLIGAFKLLKGALLVAIGFGVHHLVNRDAGEILIKWARAVRIDPQSHYLHTLIAKVTGLSPHTLRELSVGTFIYGALFLVEGGGLLLRQRWAEYMTVISTSLLLPLEVYEVVREPHVKRIALLVANVLIVAYLVLNLYRTRRRAGEKSDRKPAK